MRKLRIQASAPSLLVKSDAVPSFVIRCLLQKSNNDSRISHSIPAHWGIPLRLVSEVSASRQMDIRDAYKTSLPLDSSFVPERCSTADTGEPVLEIRRREIGTPRANTGDTPSTESTITYNQTNNETIAVLVTVLVIVAGPTTTQEVSSSVVDRSRPSVPLVAPALTGTNIVVDTTGTSSMPTAINTSPAASISSPLPSNGLPPLPPLLQWFQCVLVTVLAITGFIYWILRKRARSKLECSCHADVPRAFDGCGGRTCGSRWSPETLRNFTAMFGLLCRDSTGKRPRAV